MRSRTAWALEKTSSSLSLYHDPPQASWRSHFARNPISHLPAGASQHRVVINTVLSLTNSCIGAFLFSKLLRPHYKFDMVDIQNATLAGEGKCRSHYYPGHIVIQDSKLILEKTT